MNQLLAISIGPVQEFIAAARRTRDLWFGSFLLSEVSKAAAKAVAERGGRLIFPAIDTLDELAPESTTNVANVILAESCEADPETLADAARAAVDASWRSFADSVFRRHEKQIDAPRWNEQVDDVIEFYAAWVPIGDGDDAYRSARAKVMRLLAGRKSLRDFRPAVGHAGVWKSSLDGLRESVLIGSDQSSTGASSQGRVRVPIGWRLQPGEHLDVVGLTKRASPAERFPSIARVAADPWLRGCSPSQRQELVAACEAAVGREAITRIDVSSRGCPQYGDFPFDGTTVYVERLKEIDDSSMREELQRVLRRIGRGRPQPSPYLAVLVADGDRMGAAISRIESAERHRGLSRALAEFSAQARRVVRDHSGVLVYAGGDDVLAFLPGDRCLACARELHEEFGERLREFGVDEVSPTLSVGIAIGHFMDPMEDLLDYGRTAEANAKRPSADDDGEDRNGLAVHLVKRGGAPITIRDAWTSGLDRRLEELVELINDRAVSGRVAYDLRRLADFYRGWERNEAQAAARADVLRVLDAKRPEGGGRTDEIRELVGHSIDAAPHPAVGIDRLSRQLLVAKMLAEIARQDASFDATSSRLMETT